jgi:hypothetical protein
LDRGVDNFRERRQRWLRRRLLLHLLTFVVVISILVVINAFTGGRWWSLWIAAVWGGFLLLRFLVGIAI